MTTSMTLTSRRQRAIASAPPASTVGTDLCQCWDRNLAEAVSVYLLVVVRDLRSSDVRPRLTQPGDVDMRRRQ